MVQTDRHKQLRGSQSLLPRCRRLLSQQNCLHDMLDRCLVPLHAIVQRSDATITSGTPGLYIRAAAVPPKVYTSSRKSGFFFFEFSLSASVLSTPAHCLSSILAD